MSGHNKWSKIKNKKGAADAKRGAIFTRLGKAITLAAREGGKDPSMNFKLRIAIDAAKSANMPNDNVDRAIKKGIGEGDDGEMFEGLYEAYGPNGVAIIIETLSDNKNRIIAEVSTTLKKSGATLAESGSVLFNFERKAIVEFLNQDEKIKDKDNFELELIDAGADNIIFEDEGITVTAEMKELQPIVEAIEKYDIKPEEAGIGYIPKNKIKTDTQTQEKVDKIIDALEELDDVQNVYSSAE